MTCTASLQLAKTLKNFPDTDRSTQCVETNVFQSRLWNEEENAKENMRLRNIKLVHTVVHEELNLVIFLLKPFTLLVLSGYRTYLDNVKDESNLEEDTDSSPHDMFNKEAHMLGEWYPKEKREHDLMQSVGEFQTIAIAEQGMYIFVGTKYGCLVVFSLTLSNTSNVPFIYQARNTSKEFGDITPQVFLKPFVWSNISKLIDVPEELNETDSFDILSLQAINVSQESQHYVLVALVGPNYLAVVNFDETNGVTPIDVLNLPSKATISTVSSGGFVSSQWILNIVVYGGDAILFLKATAFYVVLLSYMNCSSFSCFLPSQLTCSSNAHLKKVHVSFSSLLNPHSQVYIASCYTLPNQQISIVLLTFNYLTQHITLNSTVLTGFFLDATFLIRSFAHRVTCHSPCHMSLDASCLCVITSQNTHLLNLPSLASVQILSNPLVSFLSQTQQEVKQTLMETEMLHEETKSSQQNVLYTPFKLNVTLTSAIPSHHGMKKILCEIKKHTISSFLLSTPLALFVMQCPNNFHLKGIWFCHKQFYDLASSLKSLDSTSYSLVNSSKNFHDNLFILKQQIEISIEKARSDPLSRFSDPLKFCEQIKNLIQVQKKSTKGVSRNFLLYIANIGKSAAFTTFDQTKKFLLGLLEILLDEEESCRTFDEHDTKPSSILERVLVKLTTFSVLHGCDHAHETCGEQSASQTDMVEPPEDMEAWFDETFRLKEIHWVSWTRFLHMDISKLAFQYASGGDLPKLCFLLNRHLNDMDKNKVTRSEKVMKILECIPVPLHSIYSEEYLASYVRHTLLPVVKNNQSFLRWVSLRALSLESVYKGPIVPLKFLNCIFPETFNCFPSLLKETHMPSTNNPNGPEHTICSCSLNNVSLPIVSLPLLPDVFVTLSEFWSGSGSVLGNLSNAPFPTLKHVTTSQTDTLFGVTRIYCLLLECYHIQIRHELTVSFISLVDNEQCWTDVAYALLNRIRLPEQLSDEIKHHVSPFCESHGLNVEEVLVAYIYDVVAQIDADMIFCNDKVIAAKLHEQERRVVVLLYCLQTDHMQAQCLLWFLHTWSPDWCFVSLEDLGLLPLLNHLKKSHSLIENPILHELQSAIMLRELQSFLGKYHIQVTLSLLTKTTDAVSLITHLACLISWKKVSFTDSLKAVRLLRPYIGLAIDNSYVGFLRLQMMTSVSNRPLITHIAHAFQTNVLKSVRDVCSLWTWEGYDAWEASWRLPFLQEIEDNVICELSEFEKMTVARNFSLYAFLTLEKTAERLGSLNPSNLQCLSMNLSMTVAECVLINLTAIYLEQQVVTAASKHSVKKTPLDQNSLKLFFPKHILQKTQQTQLHFLTGECEMSKNNLRRLKSCERLRRGFGVFVRPSQIRLNDAPKRVTPSFPGNLPYDSKHFTSSNLLSRWNNTLETRSLKYARNEFLRLTEKWSPQQTSLNFSKYQLSESKDYMTESKNLASDRQCDEMNEHKKKRQITKLLQFGVLMGVGESFARHHSILLLSSRYLTNVNTDLLTRLLTDLERNSTSRNASDILRMLRTLLPNLQDICDDARKSISVLVYLSQILNVACCCLRFLPENELKEGISFCSDILLVLQFLVQSDLLDTALDSSSNVVPLDTSDVHFSILSRLFLPLLCEKPCDLDSTLPNAVKCHENFIPTVTQRPFDNRSSKLFDTQFHNISALYKKQEALSDSMKFLLLRLKITSEEENQQDTLNDLRQHVAFIVKKLLDHESYELVIGFLLKFPEPNSTFNLLKQAAIHLLSKVIFSRDTFDYELGAGLSLLLGRSEVWSRFLNALPTIRHVSRLMFYSRLVLDVGFLLQTPYFVKNTLQVWIRAKWRTHLNALGCHYDVKRFQEVQEQPGVACNTYQKELLPHLICTSNFNLCCVQHYAKDFNISEIEFLSCWLKLILIHLPAVQHEYFSQKYIHQDPNANEDNQSYVFKEETSLTTCYRSSTSLQPTWNLQHSYRQLLYPVLYSLSCDKIEEILEKECLPHISPYDYDTLEFVLSFIKHKPAARAALMVLRHVYSYIRSDVPSEEELNNWGNELIRPASAIEKEFQKQRLPFHALMQRPWSLLGPLISDSTLNTFLPLYCLKLRRDDFQMQLLWNFIKDVRQTKGNTLAFLRGSRWNFTTTQPMPKSKADYQSFFFSEELFTIQIKLKQLFQECFNVNQERGIAAGLLILENTHLLPFGQLQVAVAELVAEQLTILAQKNVPETTQYTFSINIEQALPPYLYKELMMTYKRFGCTTPNTLTDRTSKTCLILSRTLEEALREAGTLRSRWTLFESGLGIFADLLPDCSLLCIHALYFYLAPILLRPSFIGLHNEDQLRVYVSLSQHPFFHDSKTKVFHETQQDNPIHGDQDGSTDVCCPDDRRKNSTPPASSKTIHALVDTICRGCHLNSKIARALLLRRLIKAPFWTPLYVISLLERNKNAYKDQDIIAMIGCLPTLETLMKAKDILQKIENSPLTEGFHSMWFAPFHSVRSTLPGTVERQTKLTFGQSLIEVVSKHRQYLIVHGMESRNFIKLALEIALKNERVLSTTSRTLNLLYSAESTQCIHAVYKESPEKIMDFWRHSLFLDAFDSLGITLQLGNFIKTDKAGLARAFWRQSRQITMTMMQGDEIQQQAYILLLIVSLSLNFNVKDARLFSRVLAKLLAIIRMCTNRCYQTYETMSKTLQDKSVEFLTHAYGDSIPFRKCLQAVFCTCLTQDHTGNYDKEFVSVLDTFLEAPAVDLLHLLQRITSTGSTNVVLEYNPFDICPTFQWFYLTPSLLHTSTFLHLHQTADIALKYFHVVHFLNEFIQGTISLQAQHALLFSSVPTLKETCALFQASQETIHYLECLLQKFVNIALSNSLFVSFIKHSFSMDFLFPNPLLKNQPAYLSKEQNSLPFSLKFLLTLLQFQVLSCITAYQCFDNALESLQNQKKHYHDLSNHCLGTLPILVLLLVCMPPSLHTKTKPLTQFFSNMIVKNPKALFQIILFFPLLNESTQSLYLTVLQKKAESLQLPLPPYFVPFLRQILN